MRTFYTSIFLIITLINTIYSQSTFEKVIDIGKQDMCYDIKRVGDYNYLIGTTSFSDNLDYGSLIIVKVDDNGNTKWKKVFFDFQFLSKPSFKFDVNKDNDLVITGSVCNLKSDNYLFDTGVMLSIIDTSGVVKVIKTLGQGIGGTILSLEDGYLVESYNQLFKTNLDGETVWSKVTIVNENASYGLYWNSANKTLEKKVIIVGSIANYTENKCNLLISKIDSQGNLDWINNYSSDSLNFYPEKIIQTSDSGFVVTGYSVTKLGFDLPRPLFIIKTNKNGEKVWCKSYVFSERTNVGYDVLETNDKNLIVSGAINQFGENEDMLIMKIKMTGELIWAKSYGGKSYDKGNAIVSVNDGFISTGLTNSFSENLDFFVIKADNIGNVNDSSNSLYPKINDIVIIQDIQSSVFKSENNFISDNITLKSYKMPNVENYISSTLESNRKIYNIYPNPVYDLVHVIGLTNENNYDIRIYNLEGIKVYEKKSEGANIDIRNLIRGVYVLEIQTKGQIYRFNIVKK